MKSFAAICSALLLLSTGSYAQAPDPATALSNLHHMLEQAVTVNYQNQQLAKSTFVMALPGIAFDPEAKPTTVDTDRAALADILNAVPIGDKTAQTASTTIPGIYGKVLKDKQLLVPPVPPTPAQIDERESALAKLAELQTGYETFSNAYFDAVIARAQAEADKKPNTIIQALKQKEGLALQKLQTTGKMQDYYAQYGKVRALTNKISGNEALWATRLSDLENEKINNYPVVTWPRYETWPNPAGWITVSFSADKLLANSSSTDTSASASGGFFGFSAKGGSQSHVEFSSTVINNVSMSMEVKRVRLFRHWMDSTVFYVPDWKWTNPADPVISAGKQENGVYNGLMPLVPTDLLLVRNVVINLALDDSQISAANQMIGGSAGASVFGFSAGGNYSKSSSSRHQSSEVTHSGIRIPDVQIIGYYCEVLPACPVAPAPQP